MNALLDELKWRGLVAESTDEAALAAHLDSGPVSFYVGFDPTAPSIHFGNLVQLVLARHFQAAGHRPYLLVGGATGLIGDPKQTAERSLNPADVVAAWVERIKAQVERFVSFTGPSAATVVNNYDWTSSLGTLDFLRDVGKHFSVNRMLARDVVRNRLESGISFTEFSYVLLQALDFRELFRRHHVTVQTGGSDQWGNLTAGVELIRRSEGARAHALATPLLTKADGTKFGKTESGTVWLDPEMTSPYAFHQFFLSAEDSMVGTYLRVFSMRSREEIEDLERQAREEPHRRAAQRALADDATDLVHSVGEREAAVAAAAALFGNGDLGSLPAGVLQAVAREVGGGSVASLDRVTIAQAMHTAGVVSSLSAGRRAVNEGGAYLNNVRVTDPAYELGASDLLAGGHLVLRRGKRTVGVLKVGSDQG
ncbi:MAG: tyrosine--tRNA ligase [Actinomycetia bacterium]|nr:tyrosine--tRNA ligase [Actinomycetes bacterium]